LQGLRDHRNSSVPSPDAHLTRFLFALLALPLAVTAQDAPAPPAPPLAAFAAMRVAVVPVQLWRADSSAWSREVDWGHLRLELDSILGETLRDAGLGTRWAYASDVIRSARRNPIYSSDPYSLGVGRWRSAPPKMGEAVNSVVSDNLRPITALGDTRHALIPVELRAEGELVVLRLVLVDTRSRTVVWGADLGTAAGPGMLTALAERLAELIIES